MKIIIESPHPDEEDVIIVRCASPDQQLISMLLTFQNSNTELVGYLDNKIVRLNYRDVYYFEANENRIFAYCHSDVYEIKYKLYELEEPVENQPAYAKIMRFGSEKLKKEVEDINASIAARAEEKRTALLVQLAAEQCESNSITELTQAFELFTSLGKKQEAQACSAKIESLYDNEYNRLYLDAQEAEQELKQKEQQSGSDITEKDSYDRYINDNRNKKVFDYSLLVAAGVAIIGILAVVFSVSSYFTYEGISFKTVLLCIFTRIVPGVPLTGLSTVLSFRIAKRLVKRQRENLMEDIDTAKQRVTEIDEKITAAEGEALGLKRELEATQRGI